MEFEHRLVLRGAIELGDHRLDCADEEVQRLELGRVGRLVPPWQCRWALSGRVRRPGTGAG